MQCRGSPPIPLMVNLSAPVAQAPDSESFRVTLSASLKPVNCTCNLFLSESGRLSLSSLTTSWEFELQSGLCFRSYLVASDPESDLPTFCPGGPLFCQTPGDSGEFSLDSSPRVLWRVAWFLFVRWCSLSLNLHFQKSGH